MTDLTGSAGRQQDASAPSAGQPATGVEGRQLLRALIVEDCQDDALLLVHHLRRGGYDPSWARVETDDEMRAALAAREWDVILSDYSLPRFSGLDALALTKASGIDVPFIVVSATIGEDVAVAMMKAGAHDYFMKGNLARLTPAVERELREAVVRHQHRLTEEARWEDAQIAETLARVGRDLISSLDKPVLLNQLCQLTAESLGVERSYALVWRPKDDHFVAEASVGLAREALAGGETGLPRAALAEVLARLERSDVVLANGTAGQARPPGLTTRPPQRGLYAALRRGNMVLGVLSAEDDRGERFGPRHERLAQGIAQLGSMALENARLVAELDQANRLKSEFIATMSHELRTPLHVILGYGELLLNGDFDPLTANQLDGMQALVRRARDLNALISATLDFSRLEAGRMRVRIEETDVRELLDGLRTEVEDLLKPGVRTEWQPAADMPALHTDPDKLRVVLKNLLQNAYKFTDHGRIEVTARVSRGGVEFAVSDTGVGIAPEAVPIIFEPYRQADGSSTRRFGGVGLGLHIVKRLLELIGGTVSVDSTVGRGSTFRVWVPLHAQAPPPPVASAAGHPASAPPP